MRLRQLAQTAFCVAHRAGVRQPIQMIWIIVVGGRRGQPSVPVFGRQDIRSSGRGCRGRGRGRGVCSGVLVLDKLGLDGIDRHRDPVVVRALLHRVAANPGVTLIDRITSTPPPFSVHAAMAIPLGQGYVGDVHGRTDVDAGDRLRDVAADLVLALVAHNDLGSVEATSERLLGREGDRCLASIF